MTMIILSVVATLTESLFEAWRADRSRGLDSIMLAPTRDLVAELNRRARAHRLASAGCGCSTAVPAAASSYPPAMYMIR